MAGGIAAAARFTDNNRCFSPAAVAHELPARMCGLDCELRCMQARRRAWRQRGASGCCCSPAPGGRCCCAPRWRSPPCSACCCGARAACARPLCARCRASPSPATEGGGGLRCCMHDQAGARRSCQMRSLRCQSGHASEWRHCAQVYHRQGWGRRWWSGWTILLAARGHMDDMSWA